MEIREVVWGRMRLLVEVLRMRLSFEVQNGRRRRDFKGRKNSSQLFLAELQLASLPSKQNVERGRVPLNQPLAPLVIVRYLPHLQFRNRSPLKRQVLI